MEVKERKGKVQKVTKALYFTYSWEAPCEQILTKFCLFRDMPAVIICAYFGMEKLRGLGNTGSQTLGSPIETTGHPYN